MIESKLFDEIANSFFKPGEEDIYGELELKGNKQKTELQDTLRKDVHEDSETNLEKELDNDDEDEDDIEIVLNIPTKEELEAKRQNLSTHPSLNLKTNKTYVKPGLDTGKIEKLSTGIASSQGIDLDVVGQIQGKNAYELDMESLEEKPWRKPGADLTDYFNYGFNEYTWKNYCQKQLSLRAEFGLKKRINVSKFFFSSPFFMK
jgi:pre-mRNA 3'-end-processing factor FIP1